MSNLDRNISHQLRKLDEKVSKILRNQDIIIELYNQFSTENISSYRNSGPIPNESIIPHPMEFSSGKYQKARISSITIQELILKRACNFSENLIQSKEYGITVFVKNVIQDLKEKVMISKGIFDVITCLNVFKYSLKCLHKILHNL